MSGPRSRVLVAEDDQLSQRLIAEQLRQLGFAAEIAGSGTEALERWRNGTFGLLLTDLNMPGMDGFELAAAVRKTEGVGEHLPIIALTADDHEAERCINAGMDGYLTKPVPLEKLEAALARWFP